MNSKLWVLGIVAFAVVGWMGLGVSAAAQTGSPGAAASPVSDHASATTAPAATAASTATVTTSGVTNIASTMAANALAATRAAGLKPNVVFIPRPSESAAEIAAAKEAGQITPGYTGDPAPIGLGYFGLSGSGIGPETPTYLNTTAVEGFVDANATGIQAADLYQSSPDSYGIQLNAVVTNVTLFGSTHNATGVPFEYWTQNVVEFYPSAGFMVLVTNVWNFTGGSYTGHEFYSHGPYGTNYYAELGYYYSELVVPTPISYPFNLTLTMTSSVTDGRENVSFDVQLVNPLAPSENFNLPYDWVVFNSEKAVGGVPIVTPANYQANGFSYNPIGLTNDFELDICGPGDGSQADLSTADATLGLAYFNGASFVSVPAAYNYGGETGETATGANVAWNAGPSGAPGGLADYGNMTTGPAILSGLWGTGAPSGEAKITLAETPADAFNFFSYAGATGFSSPLVSEYEYAPDMATHTYYLMPGTYTVISQLSEFTNVSTVVVSSLLSSPLTVPVTLTSDPSMGVYTPIWAFSNAEVAGLATSGAGTPASPYMLGGAQPHPFSSLYGLYNDYIFPAFPGVFLQGTTVSVEFDSPGNFAATTNDFQFPGPYVEQTNDLQWWLWDVSNVAVVDAANISGWFGAQAWYPTSFDTFSMVLYESSHNLIAGNHFWVDGGGIVSFSGGTLFGPLNIGGGNNTIWGNTFHGGTQALTPCPGTVAVPNVCLATDVLNGANGVGIEIAEGYDLVYNNYVAVPTTAWLEPLNLYSGDPELFTHDMWNITPVLATVVNHVSNFPGIALTGSIIGTVDQGGNYWWDYGIAENPYNGAVNPFNGSYYENAETLIVEIYGPSYYYATYIYGIGDLDPLTTTTEPVTFHAHGLVAGSPWLVEVAQDGLVYAYDETTSSTMAIGNLAGGSYVWIAASVPGYTEPSGSIHITGRHAINVGANFRLEHGYSILKFHESGLPRGTEWAVQLNGTTPATYAFNGTYVMTGATGEAVVLDGSYTFSVYGVPNYSPSPSSGSFAITGTTTLHVRFNLNLYGVTFTESGLPAGAHWSVRMTGPFAGHGSQTRTVSSRSTTASFLAPNGTYSFTVSAPHGYSCSASSPVTVAGSAVGVAVTCTALPEAGGAPAHFAPSALGAVRGLSIARELL